MRPPWAAARAAAAGVLLLAAPALASLVLASSRDERTALLALGPWPQAPVRDSANPASGNPAGIALGESLFHSPRLSPTGLRCASCHEPWRGFADGRVVAQGVAAGTRNTPSLLDVARHRHYGWDGVRDTLWAQSLRPLADPREMPATDADVATILRGDASLSARYATVFGSAPGVDDARVVHDVGLALAAYVETLASPRTPFDDWRDRSADSSGIPARYPAAALRGLRLFVGVAGCTTCHSGPTFSDDAFHASRVHSLAANGRADGGSPGALPNAFRTPGLRGVATTAPYFHDGSAALLCDAVRPHAADANVDTPGLSAAQRTDLVAFLRTLSPRPPDDEADCGP